MRLQFFAVLLALSGIGSARSGAAFLHEVTNTANDGPGSLRQAIVDSNADVGNSQVAFAIPGPGPHVIQPLTMLPELTEAGTRIDGSSQSGFSGEPLIWLDGSAGAGTFGLRLAAQGCSAHALEILNWGGTGVRITGPGECVVSGCRIYLDDPPPRPAGGSPAARGIEIIDSGDNVIGSAVSGEGNVIGDLDGEAIAIFGFSFQNRVIGNRIGTDVTGMQASPVSSGIISFPDASRTQIGGSEPGEGNVICAGAVAGVALFGDQNRVQGNFIGLAADGATPLPNERGILIDNCSFNTIGGPTPAARNVISGNSTGIFVRGSTSFTNRIHGNFIGTDVAGTLDIGNDFGVFVDNEAGDTQVGGSQPGEGNLISGNGSAVEFRSVGSLLAGNIVGLAADGVTPLGNDEGVLVNETGNLIGGVTTGARNVISGNRGFGLTLSQGPNQVFGNYIGTDVTGMRAAPNSVGVTVFSIATLNEVGGLASGERNVISGNERGGVYFDIVSSNNLIEGNLIGIAADGLSPLGNGGPGVLAVEVSPLFPVLNNRLSRNSIAHNGGLGIDLSLTGQPDGVTPNDADDTDPGPNGLQNFPIFSTAFIDAAGLHLQGILQSTPNANYTLEFFLNDSHDPSGNGEGERFLASEPVSVGGTGIAGWSVVVTPDIPGRWVTATATDLLGNTSEFSPAFAVTGREPTALEIVDALLGLIPMTSEYNVNSDGVTDAGDVVTQVNEVADPL